MKNVFYKLAICLAITITGLTTAQANPGSPCNIDTAGSCITGALSYGKVCPGSFTTATGGTFYTATNSFEIPDSFPLNTATFGLSFGVIIVAVDQVTATVSGLPNGLTATFDNGTGLYSPNSLHYGGCFTVSGTPCDTQGTFNVNLSLTAKVTVPFIGTITLPFPLNTPMTLTLNSTYPLLALNVPLGHLCLSGAGSSETISATPGFGNYAWSVEAPNADSLSVTTPGEYSVTVTTTDTACTFIDSIQIGSLQAAIANPNPTICKGIFHQLVASGGDTYAWMPSANLSNPTIADPTILRTLDTTTTFQVVVSNGFCTDSATATVRVNDSCTTVCGTCTPNAQGCTGLLPVVCNQIAPVQAGVEYNGTVSFFLPDSISVSSVINLPITIPGIPTTFPLTNAQILVDTLPAGLEWNSDQGSNGNKYYPSQDPSEQTGCINVCGKTCGPAGTNYMKVKAKVLLPEPLKTIVKNLVAQLGSIGGLDTIVTISLTGPAMTVYFADSLRIQPAGADTLVKGDTITLQPNLTYAKYKWSNGDSSASIQVDTAGVYYLTVTDTAGCAQTVGKQVIFATPTGISSIDQVDASLSIYPNPNDGLFNLSFSLLKNQSFTTQVFDVTGKLVYENKVAGERGLYNGAIDLTNQPKGIYMLRLTTADGTLNRKIAVE